MQREKGSTKQVRLYSLLLHAPFVRRHVKDIRESIKHEAPAAVARNLTDALGISVVPHFATENVQKTLQSESVLIVGNHPRYTEPLYVVAAMPQRPDLSAVAFAGVKRILGKEFDPFVLPVFANHPKNPDEKARQRRDNSQSLEEAGNRLEDGHAVVMMPDGGSKKEAWHPGIVRLLQSVRNDKTSLVMAYVPDAGLTDLAYAFPFVRRGRKLRRDVFFSSAISLDALRKQVDFTKDEKTVARQLEDFYKSWVVSSVSSKAY